MPDLFSPGQIGKFKIKNRLVYPPVVMFGDDYTDETGVIKEKSLQHYDRMSKGGAGLIEVEATTVSESSKILSKQLGLWHDNQIEGFKKLADICHKNDTVIFAQIQHSGLRTTTPFEPVTASKWTGTFRKKTIEARELSLDEIKQIKELFVNAAIRAQKAGLDGVELHGAHGYLISQFLLPSINQREDIYGQQRSKLGAEIISEIREACGKDFAVGIRMGMNDPDLKDSIQFAKDFEQAGADFLHVSFGFTTIVPEDLNMPEDFPLSWMVYGGGIIKKSVDIPVIVVNDILTPEQAKYAIESGTGDFAAMCRAHLVEPELGQKIQAGEKIKPCLNCKVCQWYLNDTKCPGRFGA